MAPMLTTERAAPEAQAEPERAPAAADPHPALTLQRRAGNAATARALGIQRCGGRPCQCEGDEEELLRGGAALSRAVGARRAVQREKKVKSVGKDGKCTPGRTITGVVFHPAAEKETAVAKRIVEGSAAALKKQDITLDLTLQPFLEMGDGDFTTRRGEPDEDRRINSDVALCALMGHLETMRTKAGVVILVAPFGGEVCGGGAIACYMPNLGKNCGTLKNLKRMIIVNTFAPEDEQGEVLAHELGHHADWPKYRHPTEPHNYLNFGKGRDHYFPDVLDQMCSKSFQF